MNAWQYLMKLHKLCWFQSREGRKGPASNSELRRWINAGAVTINDFKVTWDEEIDYPVLKVVVNNVRLK